MIRTEPDQDELETDDLSSRADGGDPVKVTAVLGLSASKDRVTSTMAAPKMLRSHRMPLSSIKPCEIPQLGESREGVRIERHSRDHWITNADTHLFHGNQPPRRRLNTKTLSVPPGDSQRLRHEVKSSAAGFSGTGQSLRATAKARASTGSQSERLAGWWLRLSRVLLCCSCDQRGPCPLSGPAASQSRSAAFPTNRSGFLRGRAELL